MNLIILFWSCASSKNTDSLLGETSQDSAISEEQDADLSTNDVDPSVLNGVPPQEEQPMIFFQALNSDGSIRNEEHLTQKPTVLWFFPAADTPG